MELNKKITELKVLNKVYYDIDTYNIILSEAPDFIVENKLTNEKIGVEITELYYSEESARDHKFKKPLKKRSKDDYIDAISKSIDKKNIRAVNYKKLDYLELFIEDKEYNLKTIEDIEYIETSKEIEKVINESLFRRVYIFTKINKKEILIILGDVHSGILYTNEIDIIEHEKYMRELYKNNNK